jgi:Zn-dependent protease
MEGAFIFLIAILIMSIVIHEVAHGYAADSLGDPTARYAGRLTLNPIKHLDPIGSLVVPVSLYFLTGFVFGWAKPVPFNPYNLRDQRWGEALIAGAGPASNILIALIFSALIRIGLAYEMISGPFLEIAFFAVYINIILALFNMIPVPPLDGSKILFSVLPYQFQQVRPFLEQYGMLIVLFLVFVVGLSFVFETALRLVSFMTGL